MNQLRTASKHILYGVSNSLAKNSISSSARVVSIPPALRKALYALTGIIVLLAAGVCLTAYKRTDWKKQIKIVEKNL